MPCGHTLRCVDGSESTLPQGDLDNRTSVPECRTARRKPRNRSAGSWSAPWLLQLYRRTLASATGPDNQLTTRPHRAGRAKDRQCDFATHRCSRRLRRDCSTERRARASSSRGSALALARQGIDDTEPRPDHRALSTGDQNRIRPMGCVYATVLAVVVTVVVPDPWREAIDKTSSSTEVTGRRGRSFPRVLLPAPR